MRVSEHNFYDFLVLLLTKCVLIVAVVAVVALIKLIEHEHLASAAPEFRAARAASGQRACAAK